jgi:hypothetical protein
MHTCLQPVENAGLSFFDVEYDAIFEWVQVARVYSEKLVPIIAAVTGIRDTDADRHKVWRIVRDGNVEEATVIRRKWK